MALGAPRSWFTIRTLKSAQKEAIGELVPKGEPNPDLSCPFQEGISPEAKGPLALLQNRPRDGARRTRGTTVRSTGNEVQPHGYLPQNPAVQENRVSLEARGDPAGGRGAYQLGNEQSHNLRLWLPLPHCDSCAGVRLTCSPLPPLGPLRPGSPTSPCRGKEKTEGRRAQSRKMGKDGDVPTQVNPPTTHLITVLTRAPMWSCRPGQANGALGTITASGAKGPFFTLGEKRETEAERMDYPLL